MKKTIVFFFSLLWFISAWSQGAKSNKVKFVPDTIINKSLKILDEESIINSIGDQSNQLINDENPSRIQFKNIKKSEYLVLYHLNGSNANSFNMFEFGYLTGSDSLYKTYNTAHFITGKGIKLGMSYRQVIRINENAFDTITKNNVIILKYKLTEKNLSFLQYYNMPEYSAEYFFIKNRLVKVKFGFPNL